MDFAKTLNLPQTDFPMRGNLPQREPQIQERWEQFDLYNKVQEKRRGKEKFILHDGPPYANGDIHLGHALNKIIKDIIVKFKTMDGYDSPYVPGWDTHGLPIEHAIITKKGINRREVSVVDFREMCKQYALDFIERQKGQFKRLGVRGDWVNPYITLKPEYEASQIRVFGEMAKKGYIYKGLKPVYWCASCETALAEAEIEYHDKTSPSVYVTFDVTDGKQVLPAGSKIVIWTTTPWTIPANVAIALGPDFEYEAVRAGGQILLFASALRDSVLKAAGLSGASVEQLGTWKGRELEGVVAAHPLFDRQSVVVLGDHVTLDAGTGCVHTAPGHGMEDYEVGLKYQLPILAPIDDQGKFTSEAGAYQGQFYLKANQAIRNDLQASGHLLTDQSISHQYPHCWRCKNPVMFRATEQWFASIDKFREQLLQQIAEVEWIPGWGQQRLHNMMADRQDWCISRQRVWGVPIPIFYCRDCNKELITDETIEHVANLFAEHGSQVWFAREAEDLLPPNTVCSCGHTHFRKETDIMDVWFDSGSSHAAVLANRPELRWPADLYFEGSDQYRGWFNSSLSTAVAVKGQAPYRTVLSHGFVLDGEGRKMSKSLGNVVDPLKVMQQLGADILRLWVASVDYRSDVRVSDAILKQVAEVYRKIRNTFRYLLGNLFDFDAGKNLVQKLDMPEIDRYTLNKLERVEERCLKAYRDYEFHIVYHAVHNFCTVDLSQFYLDVLKDRLYTSLPNSTARRSAQTVLYHTLHSLVRIMAPILTHTADEVWQYMQGNAYESVQFAGYDELLTGWKDDELEKKWANILRVRDEIAKALETARKDKRIGQSLEAFVEIYPDTKTFDILQGVDQLDKVLIVSKAQVYQPDAEVPADAARLEGLAVRVSAAPGEKCERCWVILEDVHAHDELGMLCPSCASTLDQMEQEI
ncbi:isoleucine--tRNA ligase [Fodinisporobacter ferrooxydans]|uniref:Isoleucine--tRNA ligase n=1 Tax=Fodinisporobacter ferrooxydans TaxID=2901836 RepID=A0ABY4CF82_9BACL|nr:isoleucine--tRNA ligase [Alicyclobacillaceae bacterium MYW30-H2]